MKNLKGKITLLFNYERGLNIQIEDANSSQMIAEISVEDPVDVVKLLSRQGLVPCSVEYYESEHIGKVPEYGDLQFKLPDGVNFSDRKEVAKMMAKELCPEGWEPQLYFSSKSSFTYEDREIIARCGIVRYHDPESEIGKKLIEERDNRI